jgi:hypothetical protein
MSYDASTLRLMGGVPGQQLFLYRSADAVGTIDDPGYFNKALADYNLSAGDILLCVSSADTSPALCALVVTVSSGTASTTKLA